VTYLRRLKIFFSLLKREEKLLENIMKNSALLPPVSNSKRFPSTKERDRKYAPQTNPNAFHGNLRISTEMG
jgi:hypothetical protein